MMRRRSSSHAIESVRLVTQATYQALKEHKVFKSYQRLRKKGHQSFEFRRKSCHKIRTALTSSRLWWFISARRWLHGDSFIMKFFSLLIRLYYSKILLNAFSIVTRDNCCWYFKYDTNKKERAQQFEGATLPAFRAVNSTHKQLSFMPRKSSRSRFNWD